MSWLVCLFWCSLIGLAYIYAGYPVAVWCAGRFRRRSEVRRSWTDRLSIVIACYNESHRLSSKLDNLFASDGADRIAEVLVGSDGSTDDTRAIIEAYPDSRVRLISFDQRRGKPAVLNDLVPQCTSPLVVLTDARQLLDPFSLTRLAERFADPQVGVVSGELTFRSSGKDSSAAEGIGAYWQYEKFLRKSESRFRSVPGATGALYAMRWNLFRPVPINTLLDDVVIPMQAIEQGYRCVLEPGAVAWDLPSQSATQESIRKRRTIAGCAQLVINQPRWLLPWRNPIWWEFVSHKLARLFSPVLMLIVLVTNVLLATQPFYQVLLIGQGLFYLSAMLGGILQQSRATRWLSVSLMFVSLNAATVSALWDVVRGRFHATWRKTT